MTSVFVTTGALGWAAAALEVSATITAARTNRIRPPSVVIDAELLQRLGRTAIPSRNGAVAHVLQIINAHPRRPETACGQVAEVGEKRHAMRKFGRRLRRPGNVVQHGGPLRIAAIDKCLVETPLAFDIEPRQAAAH